MMNDEGLKLLMYLFVGGFFGGCFSVEEGFTSGLRKFMDDSFGLCHIHPVVVCLIS